jgi:transcriptional regulator of heat shock response
VTNLSERQKTILEKIIEDYVALAQPVSSLELERKHDFGIRPAMLRIEMERLTDKGYLFQPFVSSGRVPTDKAYRFFVNSILERGVPEFSGIKTISAIMTQERQDLFKLASEMVRFLAHSSSSLALFSLPEKEILLKDGWEEIVREPEFANRDFFAGFADFLDEFEEDSQRLEINEGVNVFVGQENPLDKNGEFSLISCRCRLPGRQRGVLSLVGPKRMSYERNISLVDSLIKILNDF